MLYFLPQQEIEKRVDSREVRIGLIGLGRVGLPLAATLADEGFEVLGVDVKSEVVSKINLGECSFPDEFGLEELLSKIVAKNTFRATTQMAEVKECDLIIVAVPTLIRGDEPEIDAIKTVAGELAENLAPGTVVILESTVPPFTTQDILGKGIESGSGLRLGSDFGLAYSPERTQAPQVIKDLKTYPKIVGGVDDKSVFIASNIYSTFAPAIIKMSSLVAAEMDKVFEYTYRDVNIALANELAQICQVYDVDVYEIIKAANTQPYSHILNPGLVGGHCIPMDPYYIISHASKRGITPKLIQTARELNESVFQDVVGMIDEGSRKITILGLSFKQDVKSFETSHTLKLVQLLKERGYEVTVHDPFLDDTQFPFKTEADLYYALQGAECAILSTAHSVYGEIDFDKVKQVMSGDLIIDIRGMFSPQKVLASGLKYKGLGRISQ
jgi:nucleotide sugar dehydrogenase